MKQKNNLKNFTEYLILPILVVTSMALTFLSGCTGSMLENCSSNNNEIDNLDYVSFCAKEATGENRIYFSYPHFMKTVTNSEELNELVEGFVVSALNDMLEGRFTGNIKSDTEYWIWNNDDYTKQAMQINFKIMRNDNNFVSIVFEGLCNYKGAAHPTHYFNSLTIDIKKCELVVLSDLYRIDTDFVELVQKKYKEQIRQDLATKTGVPIEMIAEFFEESFSVSSEKFLFEVLCQTGAIDRNTELCFFLTDTALGISIPVPYTLGNHYELLIPFNELEPFIM